MKLGRRFSIYTGHTPFTIELSFFISLCVSIVSISHRFYRQELPTATTAKIKKARGSYNHLPYPQLESGMAGCESKLSVHISGWFRFCIGNISDASLDFVTGQCPSSMSVLPQGLAFSQLYKVYVLYTSSTKNPIAYRLWSVSPHQRKLQTFNTALLKIPGLILTIFVPFAGNDRTLR
jgi:hypothetical protein